MEKRVRKILDETTVRVMCQTCSRVFLDIKTSDYWQLHDWEGLDKWNVEAYIHWCENPNHLIVGDLPGLGSLMLSEFLKWKTPDPNRRFERFRELLDQAKNKLI